MTSKLDVSGYGSALPSHISLRSSQEKVGNDGIAQPPRASSGSPGERMERSNIEGIRDIRDVKTEEQTHARKSQFSDDEVEAVIRKLDWHILPLIFVLYSFSVLDRSNLGNAKIAGMQDDIDLRGNRYAWLGTIFYISCPYSLSLVVFAVAKVTDILFQWTEMGWKVFPPHRWVAGAVLAWGVVSTVQAATTSWSGMMVCRFLLAIPEAAYAPGVPLYLSFFYPRERLGLRTGIFVSGSALANAYGGALAYGISQAKGAIAPWRILFIVEGKTDFLIPLHTSKYISIQVSRLAPSQSWPGFGSQTLQQKRSS